MKGKLRSAATASWWFTISAASLIHLAGIDGGLMFIAGWLFGLFAFGVAMFIMTR